MEKSFDPIRPNIDENTHYEAMTPDWGFYIRPKKKFEDFHTGFQAITVYESTTFGTSFALDGYQMTSVKDEFFYHEPLIHTAAILNEPQTVLIIGGGDGGSAEELFKYPSIKQITKVEIDSAVIDISRKYLYEIHKGALDDKRLTIINECGFKYLTQEKKFTSLFDLIVLDLTDNFGVAEQLYTSEFYAACKKHLNPDRGIITFHIGCPLINSERIKEILSMLRHHFVIVAPYLTSVPLYGGMWMMVFCSQKIFPRYLCFNEIDKLLESYGISNLQYYNGEVHHASFALPNFIKAMCSL